jgi:Icc-related predicted phosphoesterase
MVALITADLHLPVLSSLAYKVLEEPVSPDVVFIAGDMTKKGVWKPFISWLNRAMTHWDKAKFIVVWGNADKETARRHILEHTNDRFIILDDEVIELDGIRIVGTQGCLDKPTYWQLRHIPNIGELYRKRAEWIASEVAKDPKRTIVLTHYGVGTETIEDVPDKGGLTSTYLFNLLLQNPPLAVFHGHSHHATKLEVYDPFPIFNVALPARGKPLVIELPSLQKIKTGLF